MLKQHKSAAVFIAHPCTLTPFSADPHDWCSNLIHQSTDTTSVRGTALSVFTADLQLLCVAVLEPDAAAVLVPFSGSMMVPFLQ